MKKTILAVLALCAFSMPLANHNLESRSPIQTIKRANDFSNIDPELPSEFQSEVSRYIIGDSLYINYVRGYIKVTPDNYNGYNYVFVGGKNINSEGKSSLINLDTMLEVVGDVWIEDTLNPECYRKVLGRQSRAQLDAIAVKFKEKYTEYYNKGFNLGVRCSDIKAWDGMYITQDFRYGDGNFGFDANRLNMSFLMYNQKTENVHLITNKQAEIWNSHKEELGLPVSDNQTLNVSVPGIDIKRNTEVQLFEKGFVYYTGSTYQYLTGYSYDPETETFVVVPNPIVSSNYGTFIDETEVDGVITYRYEYGTVIATLKNGVYTYEYKSGRKLLDDGTYQMIPLSQCLTWVGDVIDSSFKGDATHVSTLLKQKYTDLYNAGYFAGFKESDFSANWNDVIAQQFINSDSTASPWEGTRVNVTALVYNEEDDKIVCLKDNSLLLWNKSYSSFGAPLDDQFEGDDGTVYQEFEGGLLVIIRNQIDLSFLYEGTYDDYVAGKANYSKPVYGTTYHVDDYKLPIAVIIAVPTAVIAAGILAVVLVMKKRKIKTGE